MAQKKKVSELTEAQLNKLNTKRLLALKKTVLAKKSAIFNRNITALIIIHPFDIARQLQWDYESRRYEPSNVLQKVLDEADEYMHLEFYHERIKKILGTRENII